MALGTNCTVVMNWAKLRRRLAWSMASQEIKHALSFNLSALHCIGKCIRRHDKIPQQLPVPLPTLDDPTLQYRMRKDYTDVQYLFPRSMDKLFFSLMVMTVCECLPSLHFPTSVRRASEKHKE